MKETLTIKILVSRNAERYERLNHDFFKIFTENIIGDIAGIMRK